MSDRIETVIIGGGQAGLSTSYYLSRYRNPGGIPPGAVLVVGSGQSGCRIAEELYQNGRKVYPSTGSARRAPRRYRGKDFTWWLDKLGVIDDTVDTLVSLQERFDFRWVKFPIWDEFGYPVQERGVTQVPGLYFVGLHWLHAIKSGLFIGIGEDTGHVVGHIAGYK